MPTRLDCIHYAAGRKTAAQGGGLTMIVVIFAAVSSGVLTAAAAWSALGPLALLLASAVASAAGLLTGLLLALLRRDRPASTPVHIGVSEAAVPPRAANDRAPRRAA
jgi:hypothetical protein